MGAHGVLGSEKRVKTSPDGTVSRSTRIYLRDGVEAVRKEKADPHGNVTIKTYEKAPAGHE